MRKPETCYAKSGSVNVAYQVSGNGPTDLVWAPGIVSHLDLDWEWPAQAHLVERLSSFCRLIRFDKRGTGLSDRPTTAATLEERIDDIRAVMDAVGSKSAALLGQSEGGSMACLFAATYPARARALILWGVQARWTSAPDYPWGLAPEEMRSTIESLAEHGVTLPYLKGAGAGAGEDADPAYLDWFLRYAHAAASPAAMAALETMNSQIDIRGILPSVRAPTLVMSRTGDPVARIDAARDLASKIPEARFREWPGNTHRMLDLTDQLIPVIEEFVTGSKPSASADRILATVLFVDIVNSTGQVRSLGDSRWRQLLEQADHLAQRAIVSFRGWKVKSTGDGFLAVFDGPTRAIQCAREIRESLRALQLPIRVGLHTGECETFGDDLTGVAVHLAARIEQSAEPGEIMISGTVRDLIAGAGLRLEERGMRVLKGFPEPVRLFVVV